MSPCICKSSDGPPSPWFSAQRRKSLIPEADWIAINSQGWSCAWDHLPDTRAHTNQTKTTARDGSNPSARTERPTRSITSPMKVHSSTSAPRIAPQIPKALGNVDLGGAGFYSSEVVQSESHSSCSHLCLRLGEEHGILLEGLRRGGGPRCHRRRSAECLHEDRQGEASLL